MVERSNTSPKRTPQPRNQPVVQSPASVLRSVGFFTGCAPLLEKLDKLLRYIAPTKMSVVLQGDTGTGKELLARAIHLCSPRHEGPWVPINCATLSDELMDSELFGHKAGAYTGAKSDRPGAFVQAHGGTLFLDELGRLSPPAQGRLLRVLEDGCVTPLGGSFTEPRLVDVRVIAALSADLEAMVANGTFPRDLYFRLGGAFCRLPPLRERPDDIQFLVAEMLRADSHGRPDVRAPELSPDGLAILRAQPWPGNVRELKALVQELAARASDGCIGQELVRETLAERRAGATEPRIPGQGAVSVLLERQLEGPARPASSLPGQIAPVPACSLQVPPAPGLLPREAYASGFAAQAPPIQPSSARLSPLPEPAKRVGPANETFAPPGPTPAHRSSAHGQAPASARERSSSPGWSAALSAPDPAAAHSTPQALPDDDDQKLLEALRHHRFELAGCLSDATLVGGRSQLYQRWRRLVCRYIVQERGDLQRVSARLKGRRLERGDPLLSRVMHIVTRLEAHVAGPQEGRRQALSRYLGAPPELGFSALECWSAFQAVHTSGARTDEHRRSRTMLATF